jgi:serine/threonine protein kinase
VCRGDLHHLIDRRFPDRPVSPVCLVCDGFAALSDGYGGRVTAGPATDLLGGRYALGPVVGRGGMADVHRATDTVLDRDVAAKVFKPHVEDVDRTSSEVRLLASLNHPGLVSLFDAGTTDDGSPWLVMELVEGPTLAACCLDGSLGPDALAVVGADLAEALAHCHSRGVVHRDVKPANVLLTPDRRAKLADFGIARLVDGARHTATGLTVGTAPYFAPEQVRGTRVGPPADVYSLGLVLLECLTGQREYAERDAVACAVARLHRDPVVPDRLPSPWPGLLRRMTAADPDDRPTAAQVAAVLRSSVTGVPTEAVPVPGEDVHPTGLSRLPGAEPLADRTTVLDPYPSAADATQDRAAAGDRRALREPAAGRRLVHDRSVQAVLVGLLLTVALAGGFVAAGGLAGGAGDTPDTPLERLEQSVQR